MNRTALYRFLTVKVLKPWVMPRVFSRLESRRRVLDAIPEPKKNRRYWFHASSVGELEMLVPIIEKLDKEEELILTIFSESAERSLEQFSAQLLKDRKIIFNGYAPWEGEWKEALIRFSPDLFVTARYEAWPELWGSLGELQIPLSIVGAQARGSLKIAKQFLRVLKGSLPQFKFFAIQEEDVKGLKELFPDAQIEVTGDPRWDRVQERAARGHPRAREVVSRFSIAPKPWGILGSVWLEDLEILKDSLPFLSGTLWIVPHDVSEKSIFEIEKFLKHEKMEVVKTSDNSGLKSKCILVDEMGFLSELYAVGDWAYVGGGFGKGVHNTIEPAIHGIPVACGIKNARRFPEIAGLTKTGQLSLLRDVYDSSQWAEWLTAGRFYENKALWKRNSESQIGASLRILKLI